MNISIDFTPTEARAFLGLPDVSPLHDAWMAKMQGLMTQGVTPADMERMTRAWTAGMPGMTEGLEKMQQLFWATAMGGARKD